jgi:hypothetical protein
LAFYPCAVSRRSCNLFDARDEFAAARPYTIQSLNARFVPLNDFSRHSIANLNISAYYGDGKNYLNLLWYCGFKLNSNFQKAAFSMNLQDEEWCRQTGSQLLCRKAAANTVAGFSPPLMLVAEIFISS